MGLGTEEHTLSGVLARGQGTAALVAVLVIASDLFFSQFCEL